MPSLHPHALQRTAPPARHLFDEDGFLLDAATWSEELARGLALAEGVVSLSAEHWRVIHFIRNKYLRLGGLTSLRRLCRGTDLSRAEIKELFGDCLAMLRIAGVPNPGEEAKTYLSGLPH